MPTWSFDEKTDKCLPIVQSLKLPILEQKKHYLETMLITKPNKLNSIRRTHMMGNGHGLSSNLHTHINKCSLNIFLRNQLLLQRVVVHTCHLRLYGVPAVGGLQRIWATSETLFQTDFFFFLNLATLKARETAQLVQCLLHKYVDPSSDPQCPQSRHGSTHPVLGRWTQKNPWAY